MKQDDTVYMNFSDAKVVCMSLGRTSGPLRVREYLFSRGAQFCEISSATCLPLFLPALLCLKCERWYWQLMLPIVHDYGIMHRKCHATVMVYKVNEW